MAISVMKRVTIIAEQVNKGLLLEALQEMKGTEVVPLDEAHELDPAIFLEGSTLDSGVSQHVNYTLNKTEEAIEFLRQFGPQRPFIERMRQKRQVYTLKQLETQVESMNLMSLLDMVEKRRSRLDHLNQRVLELEEEEQFLRRWQALDFSMDEIPSLKYFDIVVGSIETEDSTKLMDDLYQLSDDIVIQEIYYTEDTCGLMIIFTQDEQVAVREIIDKASFKPLEYNYHNLPRAELQTVLDQRKAVIKERDDLRHSFRSDRQLFSQLKLAQEYYANLLERRKASQLLLNSQHLFMLRGWMDADEVSDNLLNINQVVGENAVAFFTTDVDLEQDELTDVPVKLKNNALNRPFESLTLQYGTPKYNSVDPTPFYALFQILFFGLMSADLGYGLLLFLATLIPILFFELSESMKDTLKSFNYMSIGTMLVGIFFGSFFGFELPFSAMNLSLQVIDVMVFSVAIGLVHMLVGYSLKFYLTMKDKDYASLYLDSLQWILIILGGAILALNLILSVPILNTIGLVLLLGNILGMFIVNMLTAGNPLVGFGQGLFGLIDVAGLIGDIVSYTRLTALAVAGANIGMAFNMIVGLFPPLVRFTLGIVLFIALHALNIFITYLGAYVHSMRLQFVEFFGKFYETGGRVFKPLKPQEKEVWIQKDNH